MSYTAICIVNEVAAWKAAVKLSRTLDVLIDVRCEIPYTGEPWDYRLGAIDRTVEIVGGLFDFTDHVPAPPQGENGLQFDGKRITLRNVSMQNFHGHGSGLRFDNVGVAEVVGCTFTNIGSRVLTQPGGTAWYTNAIGSFRKRTSHLRIFGNTFVRCSLNDEQLAHVLYLDAAGSILADANTYTDCGSVWGCHSPRTTIINESVQANVLCWDRRALKYVRPWLLVHNGGGLVFAKNRIGGDVDHVWHGNVPRGAVIGANQYTCSARCWALEWGVGELTREAFEAKVK